MKIKEFLKLKEKVEEFKDCSPYWYENFDFYADVSDADIRNFLAWEWEMFYRDALAFENGDKGRLVFENNPTFEEFVEFFSKEFKCEVDIERLKSIYEKRNTNSTAFRKMGVKNISEAVKLTKFYLSKFRIYELNPVILKTKRYYKEISPQVGDGHSCFVNWESTPFKFNYAPFWLAVIGGKLYLVESESGNYISRFLKIPVKVILRDGEEKIVKKVDLLFNFYNAEPDKVCIVLSQLTSNNFQHVSENRLAIYLNNSIAYITPSIENLYLYNYSIKINCPMCGRITHGRILKVSDIFTRDLDLDISSWYMILSLLNTTEYLYPYSDFIFDGCGEQRVDRVSYNHDSDSNYLSNYLDAFVLASNCLTRTYVEEHNE